MSILERFCFISEYYDNYSTMVRRFQLFYYPKDNTIEIYEIKNTPWVDSVVNWEGEKVKELEDRPIEMIKSEEQRGRKDWKKCT